MRVLRVTVQLPTAERHVPDDEDAEGEPDESASSEESGSETSDEDVPVTSQIEGKEKAKELVEGGEAEQEEDQDFRCTVPSLN